MQKPEIKMDEMITDPVNSLLGICLPLGIIGKYLLHQFEFHEILQINADLRP